MERLRDADQIGSPLAAEVDLYCGPELYALLSLLGDELRFVLITSYARLHEANHRPPEAVAAENVSDGLWIAVSASSHEKCIRCWHRREDVGRSANHPEICARCVDNVEGAGERRRYA